MYSLSSVDIQGWCIGLSWANIIQVTNQTRATEPAIRCENMRVIWNQDASEKKDHHASRTLWLAPHHEGTLISNTTKILSFSVKSVAGVQQKNTWKKLTLARRGEKPFSYQKRTKISWMLSLNTNYKNTVSKSRWLLDRPALPNYLLRSLVRETHLFEALNKFQVYWAPRNL